MLTAYHCIIFNHRDNQKIVWIPTDCLLAGNVAGSRLVGIKPIIIIMQERWWLVGLLVLPKTVSTVNMHIIFECTADITTPANQNCQITTCLQY